MPTNPQLRLINLAWKQAGMTEERYRLILLNTAGVTSGRDLMNADVENVLAVLEDCGFRYAGHAADHFRNKVATRNAFCGDRLAFKVRELAGRQTYALDGLCRRFSGGRTEHVDKLRPHEASKLVEMLKAVIERGGAAAAAGDESDDGAGGECRPADTCEARPAGRENGEER